MSDKRNSSSMNAEPTKEQISSCRIYDYICEHCDKHFEALRPEAERRADILCPHCGLLCNGDKCKRIMSAPEVRYAQGKQKGFNNSLG